MNKEYDVTIGLEVHCELLTNSKIFSASPNRYSEVANLNISEVDLGLPGILPVVSNASVEKAIKMSMALNCELPKYMYFDRKNYYYPDLPKGYQITQTKDPVGINGFVNVYVGDTVKRIDIHDIHLEEDTASLDHYDNYSLIDYNRSSIPLLETVTTPCMHSADEALAFLESLRRMFLYTNISEARTDRGQMRCDVNISLAPKGSEVLGTKVEIKNINSFSNVKLAIEYEIKRQTEVLNEGGSLVMETRRFDDTTGKTYRMREKVENLDYKYFIEPNIPPFLITDELVTRLKDELPVLQYDRIVKYMAEYGLSLYDSEILTKNIETASYFEAAISNCDDIKGVANWINTRILGFVNKEEITINECTFTTDDLVSLIGYINANTISSKQAKDVFYKCLEEKKSPNVVIKENNMEQITNSDEILNVIKEVINENMELAKEYDPEKGRVVDFFVGQIMKKTRGKANPKTAMDLIKEELLKIER